MKEEPKKTAPKTKVQIKDIAPKKDAKGGSSKHLEAAHLRGAHQHLNK